MSAHGGILHFDAAVVTPNQLSILSKSLEQRGPDGGAVYSDGPLCMASCAFHTNRASKLERQPLTSPHGLVLTWDGRLDNREEIIAKLSDTAEDVETDAALVLAAYMRWGMDCFADLIGDWALALWDTKKKALLLARDFPGNRPLYYQVNKTSVIWSSELETFLDIYSQSHTTDEREYIGYVEKKRGQSGRHLDENEYQLFLPSETLTYISRPQPNLGRSTKLAQLMAQNGARVLLSGQGGDGVMWSMERPCLDLADLLAAKQLRKLHARIKAYSLSTGRTYWDIFWTDAVNSHDARPVASASSRRMANDPWINWRLLAKFQQEQTNNALAANDSSLPASRRISYKIISDAVRILSLQHFRTCGNVDASYPYLDRRLIQFMLSVPFEQKRKEEEQ